MPFCINVKSDLGSTLSDEKIFFPQKKSGIALADNNLTLSQMTIFRLFQTESLETTVVEIGRKPSKQVENTVGKGEIACTKFSHSVFIRLVLQTSKTRACLGKG